MVHYETFEYILQSYKNLIWNTANDPDLRRQIEPFGYTPEELNHGKTLYNLLSETVEIQKVKFRQQFTATNKYNSSRNTIESNYELLHEQCKFVLTDNRELWSFLHLSESIPADYYEWHPFVLRFYTCLLSLPDVITQLRPFGHSTSSIQATVSLLVTINDLQVVRKREGGESQKLAFKRDVYYQELKIYCSKLKKLLHLIRKNIEDIELVKEKPNVAS